MGDEKKVVITNTTGSAAGKLSVALTTTTNSMAQILKNGKVLGKITLSLKNDNPTEDISYLKATEKVPLIPFPISRIRIPFSIKVLSGTSIRLDYISVTWAEPEAVPLPLRTWPPVERFRLPSMSQPTASPTRIIMPMEQPIWSSSSRPHRNCKQAQRLKKFHEQHDGLRVTIVPADELYNEFSSGTPDANAYRRYLRMLSDKAQSEADMPKYLLLFGDCVWDNRMLTSGCRTRIQTIICCVFRE